jgi:lysozyme
MKALKITLKINENIAAAFMYKRLNDKATGLEKIMESRNMFRIRPVVQVILLEMAYQMGCRGVGKFDNMWNALEVGDYRVAADEMLDSRWARQTPARANRLADRMRSEV